MSAILCRPQCVKTLQRSFDVIVMIAARLSGVEPETHIHEMYDSFLGVVFAASILFAFMIKIPWT